MNNRLARKHAAMLPTNSIVPPSWIICHGKSMSDPYHPMPHPPNEVCSACCPPDPPKPAAGMPVIVNWANCVPERGVVTHIYNSGNYNVDMNSGTVALFTSTEWLSYVEPDYARWGANVSPAPIVSVPRVNGIIDIAKCHHCKEANPYPNDSEPNCDEGWRCGRCRTIVGLQ